jgi:hypothetical protein
MLDLVVLMELFNRVQIKDENDGRLRGHERGLLCSLLLAEGASDPTWNTGDQFPFPTTRMPRKHPQSHPRASTAQPHASSTERRGEHVHSIKHFSSLLFSRKSLSKLHDFL